MNSPPSPERNFRFPKNERLCRRAAFDYLFKHGSAIRVHMLKFFYVTDLPEELETARLSVGFSVPKRQFKRAVDRNLLKRKMREAYRLNKHILLDELQLKERNLVLLIKYNTRDFRTYQEIETAVVIALRRLKKKF